MKPRSRLEWTLEGIALGGVLSPFAITALFWSELPERIAVHFDFEGQPNGWGPRALMFTIPVINSMSYLLLTAIGSRAHSMQGMNLPAKVNRDHPEVRRLGRELISWVKALMTLLMSYLTWGKAQVALGRSAAMGSALPLATVAVILLLAIFYTSRMKRLGQ